MKIYFNCVGCRLNQSEIERLSNQFRMAGHEIAHSVEESDLVVINTCTVTSAAAADSRRLTRQAYRRNPNARIVLTGCWSTLEREEAQKFPGVIQVIDNSDKDQLVEHVLNLPENETLLEPTVRYPLHGRRARTRAFIKVQDGCDNSCTFCITTIARGDARSVSQSRVIHEVQAAAAAGIQEVVLTGVQLTAYGKDRNNGYNLETLVKSILAHTEIPRLRLSSLEPWEIERNFFQLWKDPRMCRQLHLPLQSGSTTTLRRMGRPITPQAYADLISKAREKIPSVAITTDILVGFPGETEAEFEQSLSFIDQIGFARAHVFTYSPRPGTPAYRLPQRVPVQISRKRNKIVRDTVAKSSLKFRGSFLGKTLIALWEKATPLDDNNWEMQGLTDNYLRVRAIASSNLWNHLSPIQILKVEENDLFSEIIHG
jgi:threonylcarbamoyladenosine tRNA methylthiotransferase MtaB